MEVKQQTEFYNVDEKSFKITTIEPVNYRFDLQYVFNVGFAQQIGLNEAIMLNNLIFWTQTNKANNNNFFDGYFWTYNTIKAFQELFPFWTGRQIRYILKSLEKKKIIKTGNYNKFKYDHTKWYAIIDNSILQFCQLEMTEKSNEIDNNVKPIPDINTDIKTNINTDINEIYSLYPTRDINNNNRCTSKSNNDKKKIASLLKQHTKDDLIKRMIFYLKECETKKTYLKNFSVFLNNLPEIVEENKQEQYEFHDDLREILREKGLK